MPTYVRLAYQEPRGTGLSKELPAVSIFLLIGLIQVVVALLNGAQLAAMLAEQPIW